jgi:hypothetical protein
MFLNCERAIPVIIPCLFAPKSPEGDLKINGYFLNPLQGEGGL